MSKTAQSLKNIELMICLLVLTISFTSCHRYVDFKTITIEENTFAGLYETDTVTNGKPVPDVNIHFYVQEINRNKPLIDCKIKTDSIGVYEKYFIVPSFGAIETLSGFISWDKVGYKKDTLFLNHSSITKRNVIINMERSE